MNVRYPTLSEEATRELFEARVRGESAPVGPRTTWRGSGEEVDLSAFAAAMAEFEAELRSMPNLPTDWEPLEGRMSAAVHAALERLPVEVLDDHRFWAYLALEYSWWYIDQRERSAIAKGNGLKYTANRLAADAIPIRLFLRGQAALADGDYSPAHALDRSTDFWRSHVTRVRTGSAPRLTRAFVALQAEHHMPTERVLRPFARRLNRTWSNVVLHLYDESAAARLVGELYDASTLPPPTGDPEPGPRTSS